MRAILPPSLGKLALLGICLLCCSMTGTAAAQTTDNGSYCSKTARIQVFLLDITTKYDDIDKRIIERMMGDVLSSAAGGDRIIIRTIADSHTRSERLIERCVPYCAARGFFEELVKCSEGSIRADKEFVRRDILSALRTKLSTFEELKYSDIIRTISSVSVEDAQTGQRMMLHVYSDLIENSDYMSGAAFFYYSVPFKIEGLKKLKLIAQLKDAEVDVVGVGRAGTADRRPLTVGELAKVTDFWNAYFKESGATKVRISQNPVSHSD